MYRAVKATYIEAIVIERSCLSQKQTSRRRRSEEASSVSCNRRAGMERNADRAVE